MRFDLALVVTLVAAPVFGSVTTYTDVAAWAVSASNAPNVTFEGAIINNGQIQAPDLTISTQTMFAGQTGPGSGKAIGDLWADCVGKSGCSSGLNDTTTFTFDEPVYAFAGNWDLQGGTGAGLEVYTLGPQAVSPNQTATPRGLFGTDYQGFWGFVSTSPFETITFASSYGDQNFTLSDMTYAIDPPPAVAPEPATMLLFGIGCIGIGLARKRTRR